MSEFTISVRDLAAFCYRSGDIDYRFNASPTAQQGMEGHQRVYKNRPASYQREYSVSFTRQQGENALRVLGRADGYDPGDGGDSAVISAVIDRRKEACVGRYR